MANDPRLMAAYQALFSNSPQGALMRRRVRLGLSTGGQQMSGGAPVPNEGTVGVYNPYIGGRTGGSGSPGGMPSGVPGGGTPGGGVPGMSTQDRYNAGIPAPTGMRNNWGFSFNTANAKTGAKIGAIPGGLVGAGIGYGIGGLFGRQPQVAFPGYRMPAFTGAPPRNFGGFDPGREPGVQGGYAGYGGGGPDERGGGFGGGGGSSGGGLGGGSGAEGPDPSGWA